MIVTHKLKWLAAAAALALAGAAGADVQKGVDAWQAGNFTAAVAEFRPLANQGNADAQFNMGQAYRLGRGVTADLKIAQSWFQKAAAQGHVQAQANLGLLMFQAGQQKAAMPWIMKAAARGDARSQYILGTAHFNGDHAAKDWPRAYALMTRAAAQGLPPAAASLAQMDQFIPITERQKGVALASTLDNPAVPAPVRTAAPAKPAASKPIATAAVPAPAAKPAAAPAAPPVAGGRWRIQLGAYASQAAAQGQWAALSKKILALSGLQPSYEAAGKLTRLRVGPLASRAAADKVCASAKAAGQACFPVAP